MTGDAHGRQLPVGGRQSADDRHKPLDSTPVHFVQSMGERGIEWSVVEVDASAVPGAPAARCLIFARQDCIRRVWNYPVDWRALDSAGLFALSWQR